MTLEQLVFLARLSDAAYEITEEEASARAKVKLTLLQEGKHTGWFAHLDGINFLAFRGTPFFQHSDPVVILKNFEIAARDLGDGKEVAEGYFQGLPEYFARCVVPGLHDDPWIVTGHSLGGISAEFVGSFFPEDTNVQIVSFGAPKGANEKYWTGKNRRITRVVNERDFAPEWPLGCYAQTTSDFLWLFDGVLAKATSRPGFNLSETDHGIRDGYLAGLEKLKEKGSNIE